MASADCDFLLEVYASTRRAELTAAGFDPTALEAFLRMQFQLRQQHYRAYYPGAAHDVLLVLGVDAGHLIVSRSEREIVVVNLALLPAHRGLGIGTQCLSRLTREAHERGARVRLSVRPDNRARRLYRRLGFRELSEDSTNVVMEWMADGWLRASEAPGREQTECQTGTSD